MVWGRCGEGRSHLRSDFAILVNCFKLRQRKQKEIVFKEFLHNLPFGEWNVSHQTPVYIQVEMSKFLCKYMSILECHPSKACLIVTFAVQFHSNQREAIKQKCRIVWFLLIVWNQTILHMNLSAAINMVGFVGSISLQLGSRYLTFTCALIN